MGGQAGETHTRSTDRRKELSSLPADRLFETQANETPYRRPSSVRQVTGACLPCHHAPKSLALASIVFLMSRRASVIVSGSCPVLLLLVRERQAEKRPPEDRPGKKETRATQLNLEPHTRVHAMRCDAIPIPIRLWTATTTNYLQLIPNSDPDDD